MPGESDMPVSVLTWSLSVTNVGRMGFVSRVAGPVFSRPRADADVERGRRSVALGRLHLLGQVQRLAHRFDEAELRLEVVDVVLLVGQDALEQVRRGVVADAAHVLDALAQTRH